VADRALARSHSGVQVGRVPIFFSEFASGGPTRLALSLSLSLSNAALPPLMCTGLHTPRFAALARLARTTVTQAAAVAGECVEAGGWGPNQFSFAPA